MGPTSSSVRLHIYLPSHVHVWLKYRWMWCNQSYSLTSTAYYWPSIETGNLTSIILFEGRFLSHRAFGKLKKSFTEYSVLKMLTFAWWKCYSIRWRNKQKAHGSYIMICAVVPQQNLCSKCIYQIPWSSHNGLKTKTKIRYKNDFNQKSNTGNLKEKK